MFENIKDFFGRVKSGMYDKGVIGRAIPEGIAVSNEMNDAVELWSAMFEEKSGLQLPAAISFEMARLITVEMKSVISGSSRAEYLNGIYSNVIENIRIPVEYGCAKGGLVLKPYVSKGKIFVDFIQADSFFPISFDSAGKISGAVFVQSLMKNGRYYTRFEGHQLKDGIYEISNRAFCSHTRNSIGKPIGLSEVEEWKELSEKLVLNNILHPLFGYFKPAIANTVDTSSPLGVSVFANAVNLIEDANCQYERFLWEFESGERALIANTMAFKRDRDGKPKLPDRRLYRTLDVEDMDFFREWSPQIREEQLSKGLNRIFRQIEFNCGFAYGTLSEVSDSEKTAEEVRASKQRSYATVADNQKALKNALTELVYAMDVWCTLYSLAPKGDYGISFEFDDSIAADRKTQFEEKQAMVACGIMAPWEFRAWYFGEDEETAKKNVSLCTEKN
ncbi:MAG: phage portal protein [Ruminococcaceae bacterium]|nr:phage portal protein [Oscillospiraceae bacterium]